MEQAREVKKLAREFFPGGALVYGNDRFGDTGQLVADPATKTVYEAAFRDGPLIVEVDILRRDGSNWNVIEVKSSFPDSNKMDDYVDSLPTGRWALGAAFTAAVRTRRLGKAMPATYSFHRFGGQESAR